MFYFFIVHLEFKLKNIILIKGIVGDGYFGDIGIDDITLTSGCIFDSTSLFSTNKPPTSTTTSNVCINEFKCKSNDQIQCISYDKVCNFLSDCDDSSDEEDCGTCDFEQSSCGWSDQSNDKFIWSRRQAPSSNPQGPQYDHTHGQTKNGYFIKTEINPLGQFVNQAILKGPKLQATSENCKVSMWIHMKSSSSYASIDFLFTNASDYCDYYFLETISGSLGKS